MRSINFLLIVVLLTVQIFTVKIDFASFVELSDLKGDTYAESLVQTINTALQAKGGNIESIQDLLLELYTKLIADQKTADRKWGKREGSLNVTITDTTRVITKLTEEISAAEVRLATKVKLISRSKVNIQQYGDQKTADLNMLQTLKMKRNLDSATYKENVRNHQDLILTVDTVIKELKKLSGSVAGERPVHVEKGTTEDRDRAWSKKHNKSNNLLQIFSQGDITSFLQAATEADQDSLANLINLLKSLRRSAQNSLADDDVHEKDSIRHFNSALTRLTADIALLDVTLVRQRSNLSKYEKERVELITMISVKTNLRIKNQKFLAETIELRRIEKEKYEADKRARQREMVIIQKLRKIVDEKLSRMKDFLKKKVNN